MVFSRGIHPAIDRSIDVKNRALLRTRIAPRLSVRSDQVNPAPLYHPWQGSNIVSCLFEGQGKPDMVCSSNNEQARRQPKRPEGAVR